MPLEFAKLTAQQIDTLSREKTVFFFPVGPIEDHGPHLPVGLALAIATKQCQLAGERLERELPDWKAVLMPSVALGVESQTGRLALTVRAHVLRDWLVDSCRALHKVGFTQFVCFSGILSPRQLAAIEDASKLLWKNALLKRKAARPHLVSASSALVDSAVVWHSPFWPAPEEHGGALDTSLALAIARGIVDPISSALPAVAPSHGVIGHGLQRARGKVSGYWGDPTQASAERGQELYSQQLERIWPKLLLVWNGANPHRTFRSWYGILPPNQSFFRSWILALVLAVTVIAMLWVLAQMS